MDLLFNLYLYCINKDIYPLFISIKDGWRISIVYRPCDNGMYVAFCIVYRPCANGMYVAFCKTSVALKIFGHSRY